MAASEKQLAENLKEAGTLLLSPPSSVDELLPILDEVGKILENVEQSPSGTMQDALWPTRNALVSKELLGHSDPDVNVSVATCISEITRITAPDAPYSDDQMKEIFQLIVSTFEKLHDVSNRSFNKRTAILDIVAKVRSCVVMLDLECDTLILEMFQHFLKSVTDNHPEKVISSMATIMTLVIEESEEISPELLSPILETLKKDNMNVDPAARRLGENVLKKCASKVKPYLVQAIKILGVSLDDYSNAVATVCQEISCDVELNDANTASINSANQVDIRNQSSGDAVKEVKETVVETTPQDEVSPAPEKLESTMSNGNLPKVVEEAEAVKELLSEKKCDDNIENKATEISKTDKVGANLIVKPQPKGKSSKKRGRKGSLSKSTSKRSAEATPSLDNGAEEVTELQESKSKDSGNLHCEDAPADNKSPSNNEKGVDLQQPLSKASKNEALEDVPSPSASGGLPEGSHTKKATTETKGKAVVEEVRTSPEGDSNKNPEVEASDKEDISLRPVDESRKDDQNSIDSDTKTKCVSGKKVESGSDQQTEKKRKGQGKPASIKEHVKPLPKKESKEPASPPKGATKTAKKEPSSASSKRKRSAGKDKASEIDKHGEELVGSKIRVWWPKDKQFYKGTVESFSPANKKHKVVLYSDGDVEVLNLAKEKWEHINDDENSDKGYLSDGETPDASEMRTKKRTKTIPESSNKSGNSQSAKKKVRGTSSSRSKVAVSKPGSKQSNDELAVEKTSNDEDDSKDEKGGNSSDANSGDESMDETPKAAGKSKEDDFETPKPSSKGKQQTAKGNNTRSKVKTGKGTGSKSNANKAGKGKAGSSASKGKEAEKTKKSGNESAKSSQGGKSKSSSTPPKALKAETNSGKKRKRGGSKNCTVKWERLG
ncbi:hypothetical protein V2J09_010847 [Rumex salicifolius]